MTWCKEKGSSNRSDYRAIAFLNPSMFLTGAALFFFVGQSVSLATSEWFLVSRHGECLEV